LSGLTLSNDRLMTKTKWRK